MNYTMLPNNLVYANSEEQSIITKCEDVRITQLIIGICQSLDIRGRYVCSLYSILASCGIDNTKDNLKMVKVQLNKLKECGYISSNVDDFTNVKPSDAIFIYMSLFKKQGDRKTGYFKLFDDDLQKILELKMDARQKINILNLYCFYSATVGAHNHSDICDLQERPPLCCWHSCSKIGVCINLTKPSILSAMNILLELNLIVSDSAGRFTNKYETITSPNFVTLTRIGDEEVQYDEIKKAQNQYIHVKKSEGFSLIVKHKVKQTSAEKKQSTKSSPSTVTTTEPPETLRSIKDEFTKLNEKIRYTQERTASDDARLAYLTSRAIALYKAGYTLEG